MARLYISHLAPSKLNFVLKLGGRTASLHESVPILSRAGGSDRPGRLSANFSNYSQIKPPPPCTLLRSAAAILSP